jgi:tetratricopeptide (TPR) repeat protein
VASGDTKAQALAYYERGNALLDTGDNAAAVADYDRSIALDPTNARAFNNRALALTALGRIDEALASYGEAIRLDPSYIRANKNLLRLQEERGDLQAVAAGYARLAAFDPANAADYRYHEGSALHGLRDFAGARKAYDAALAADPQQVDALYERALLSFAEGNPAAAIVDLDAALRLSPHAANAYYARGLARAATGDHAAAIADFGTALAEHQGDYPEALLARAAAYHTSGDDAKARADLDALGKMQVDEGIMAAAEGLRVQVAGK